MSIADAYNHLRKIHDTLHAKLDGLGVEVGYDAATGLPVSVELPGEPLQRAVDMEDLAARQMETIDALRGVVATMSRAVEALAGKGAVSGAPGPETEARIANLLDRVQAMEEQRKHAHDAIDQLESDRAEMHEKLEAYRKALTPVSVMLGYRGEITEAFMKYIQRRPAKTEPPSAYLLPDGTHTNEMTTALAEWIDQSREKYEEARKLAAQRKIENGRPSIDTSL